MKCLIQIIWMLSLSSVRANAVNSIMSGNWNDSASWSGSIPTASDTAIITGGYVVTNDSGGSVAADIIIGSGGSGQFIMVSGDLSTTSNHFKIANKSGDTGTVYMSGGSVTICSNRSTQIGGVQTSSTTARAYLNISGGTFGGQNISVGVWGYGELNISGTGAVNALNFYVGDRAGSTGIVNLAGGELVMTGNALIGRDAVSHGEVNIAGGSFTSAKALSVGLAGFGKFSVQGTGGTFTCDDAVTFGSNAVYEAVLDSSGVTTITAGNSKNITLGGQLLLRASAGVSNLPASVLLFQAQGGGVITGDFKTVDLGSLPGELVRSVREIRLVQTNVTGSVLPGFLFALVGRGDVYPLIGGYNVLNGSFDVITVQGQSLSVGNNFLEPATAPAVTQTTDAFILDGLLTHAGSPLSVQGWLAKNHNGTATGIKPVRYANSVANPISTAALPVALAVNDQRRALGVMERRAVLTTCHGYGGVPWEDIDDDPNTGENMYIWPNMQFWYGQAAAVISSFGVQARVPWHVIVHGESALQAKQASPIYYNFLVDYLADYTALIHQAGFSGTPRLILTQCSGYASGNSQPDAILDQLRFCIDGRGVMGAPLYPYPVKDNNVHPDGKQTMFFCDVIARAIAEEESGHPWTPLQASASVTGTTVRLIFNTRPDEVLVQHDPAKYNGEGIDSFWGFEASGANIVSVSITGSNQVDVICDAVPVAIQYALQYQNVTGFVNNIYPSHRGLLRTSYSWMSQFYGEQLYRWIPSFRIVLE